MFNKHSNRFILLCVSGLLSACASTPPTNFYTLDSQSQSPGITASTLEKKSLIGIGPLSLPALLDRDQIVTRTDNNGIALAEFHQWAAPLKENVIAVLRENITSLQPNSIVRTYPWSAYGNVDYRVIVDITRFDIRLGQLVNLDANWAIMQEQNHTIVSNGQAKFEQPLKDASYPSAASGLSNLLGQLSQQIAVSLHQVQQK